MEYRFAQVLHGKLYKRTLFIVLVVLVHINSNFNEVIRLSFHGKIQEAIVLTNYQWLMLYPCLYFFAMWDAFKEAGGGVNPFSYLPSPICLFSGICNSRALVLIKSKGFWNHSWDYVVSHVMCFSWTSNRNQLKENFEWQLYQH